MPELPEVETIVRQLRRAVNFRTIQRVEIKDQKVIHPSAARNLPARIIDVSRRGKSIIFTLDNNHYLLAHLRMTGHFHFVPKGNRKSVYKTERAIGDDGTTGGVITAGEHAYQKYLSGIFHLDDGSFFTFNEIRRFGLIRQVSAEELELHFSTWGEDPLNSAFTFAQFNTLLNRFPQSLIKVKLMDQSFLAGIGNIYAQEALYRAGIHPQKKLGEISHIKRKILHIKLRQLLQEAIEKNGTTIQNFSHLSGEGEFQNFLSVYQQERCPKGHSIEKRNLGGRGTYYCPKCQGK